MRDRLAIQNVMSVDRHGKMQISPEALARVNINVSWIPNSRWPDVASTSYDLLPSFRIDLSSSNQSICADTGPRFKVE